MKVLMIAPTPFFSDRGAHVQIYEEIRALSKLDVEVHVCTYGLGRNIEGIRASRIFNFPWYRKVSAGPSLTKIIYIPMLFLHSLVMSYVFKPEIIHAHLPDGAVIARLIKLIRPKLAYVYDVQGSLSEESIQHGFFHRDSLIHKFFRFLEKKTLNWFENITQSNTVMAYSQKLAGENILITNVMDGVDTEIFAPNHSDTSLAKSLGILESEINLIYVGALEEYQGVDLLLKAFSLLNLRHHNLKLIIIGFPNIPKYRAQAVELNISEKVIFLGKVDYFQLPKYLCLGDIAIAPKISTTEGDGKIYNYLACGLPVVAFEREVAREIAGETALYAKFLDYADLASKIEMLISDNEFRIALGSKGRFRAESLLSWNAVGERIYYIYLNLLEKRDK